MTISKPTVANINLGYYQTKADNGICFKSRATETSKNQNLTLGDIIELGDKCYILETGNPVLVGDKTISPLTKIFVLNALVKMMGKEESEAIFNVAISSPPVSYSLQKEQLPLFLEGTFDIVYNNVAKKIIINKVIVYPETFIAYLVNSPTRLKDKKVIIIDIGGKTTNICRLDKNKFSLKDDYITIQSGMFNIDSKIAGLINSQDLEVNYQEDDVSYIRENNTNKWKKYFNLAEGVYRKHSEDIFSNIRKNSWNLDEDYIVLVCGGGGTVLIKYIQELFEGAKLSNDPLFDNQKALEVISKGVFK